MNNEKQNFFDARTIMAIVLVAGTFLGWQFYMQKKYPDSFKKKSAVTAPATGDAKVQTDAKPAVPVSSPTASPASPDSTAAAPEKLIRFESENMSFDISSKGMGVKNVLIRKFKDRKGNTVELGQSLDGEASLVTALRGQPAALDFVIEQSSPGIYVGRARMGGMEIVKTMEIAPDKYLIRTKLSSSGNETRFVGVSTQLRETVKEIEGGHFFTPNTTYQEFFVETSETDSRHVFAKEDFKEEFSKVHVASIGSAFFTQAVVDRSNIMPKAKLNLDHGTKKASVILDYETLPDQALQLEYDVYLGPKSIELLSSIDRGLSNVVDFGYFNWIGRQILSVLKWSYQWTGNWGFAIILLTLMVRLLVLPANLYSFKSMKSMQTIQPKLQALREKYKDDQQKQQQEIMALMRENKVNPLGGCLPMFLQFPIFLALYQVLGHSIELYQAPFALWIPDLSLKDPYYILPVLMGVTMFIQQKITPNTMDPAQAKILLFMPLVFIIFMLEIASGLSLYMWVGAIFGVLQQMYFMREKKPSVPAIAN